MAINKLWFAAKKYGWGWYPVSWQAWLITFGYLLLIIFGGSKFDRINEPSLKSTLLFFGWIIFWTVPLLYICYQKGEAPRWRWGDKDRR